MQRKVLVALVLQLGGAHVVLHIVRRLLLPELLLGAGALRPSASRGGGGVRRALPKKVEVLQAIQLAREEVVVVVMVKESLKGESKKVR